MPAIATNGLNSIGFGLESLAMGGADVAVARDPLALNTNPAGLAWVRGFNVEAQGALAHELGIEHSDQFNPPTDMQNDYIPLGNLAVSKSVDRIATTVGASLAVTGGSGFDYGRINTPFGTKDRLSSLFGIVRGSLGGAVQLTDQLSVGANVSLSYSHLDQEFFPDTSILGPNGPFFGTKIQDARAYGTGFRLGVLWRPSDRLALGAAYGSKVDLPVEDGRIDVDLTALGIGKVKYRDLKLDGLAQAQEITLGGAYQLTSEWLIAGDLTWVDWSGALGTTTLRASEPDNPAAPAVIRNSSTQDWRDQFVLAFGTAYQPIEPLQLWAGYNYGRNPVPNQHLSPLLMNIGEHHLTGGAAWKVDKNIRVGLSVEYLLPNEVTYDNQELPFGSDTRARMSYLSLYIGLSWRL